MKAKFKIDDIVYKTDSINGTCMKYTIECIMIYKNRIEYRCRRSDNGTITQIEENKLFSSKTDCEKDYILYKYSHLFKDSKTLI